ncbi:MAG TPA: DUF4340 domain-containing protein [Clostridia bacterium]|nr:DUF4340 domain-containing protein [Clostridia bacterium]
MKLYRNAIILVIVLGLLVGAYMIFGKNKKESSSVQGTTTVSETNKAEKVFSTDTEKITEFTVQNKNGTFVFNKKGDSWEYPAGEKGFRLSSEKVEAMVSSIADVDSEEVIEKNATDLAQYGLNNPINVTIKTKNGKTTILQIGSATSSGDTYYIKLKDSSKVYTVGSYACDSLNFSKNDITDITLFTSNADDITKFILEKQGQLPISIQKKDKTWRMTAPVEGEIDSDFMGSMLSGLIQSTIISNIETNAADLSKYALKDPNYVLDVETAKTKTKLLIGKEDKVNGLFYARLDGSNTVFTIDSDNYTFIDRPLKEFIVPLVYLQDINKVSKVVVELDGKKTLCSIDSDKDELTKESFTVNGKDANMEDKNGNSLFRQYYMSLIGVPFDTIEMGAKPTGKSELTITYTYKDGSAPVKIEYIPKDNDYYYAVKNGKYTNFLVLKKVLDNSDGIRAMYSQLMKALK